MLSEKIYALRRQSGLSQEQLAEKIGVSRQAISKWETGTATPELDKLIALSDCFGVTLDELIRGSEAGDEPHSPQQLPDECGGRAMKIGAWLCGSGAVGMLIAGALMLASPTAADRLNASSAVTLRGSGLLLLLCAAAMAAGLGLILKRR